MNVEPSSGAMLSAMKEALFAEDAADFVKRLTLANKRDHWKIVAILKILTGDNYGK